MIRDREYDEWLARRRRMVEEQITSRGVRDARVLEAMTDVPRERFVPPELMAAACEDRALPIGHDQTISQPFIVAYMTEQLACRADGTVLEIGTGSGYQTAVLARLCRHVYTIERLEAVQQTAVENLDRLGVTNVTAVVGDGSAGLPQHAPFDRILVTAASPKVPRPLLDQLTDDGVLVLPVGGEVEQTIVRVTRQGERTVEVPMLGCRFVKLIGEEGFRADPAA